MDKEKFLKSEKIFESIKKVEDALKSFRVSSPLSAVAVRIGFKHYNPNYRELDLPEALELKLRANVIRILEEELASLNVEFNSL